jgi:RNA polymerase primary sigma factor
MASMIKVTPQEEETLEKEGPETLPDCPLLDLSDAAVKELSRSAKKRGYVTHDQINALLASAEVKSEQIEDILAKFSEMGVSVVETTEAESEEEVTTREEPEAEAEGENDLIELQQRSVPAKSAAKEPAERTDDPVRMYLREMGSKELLSREGEIAIAKRIEAGREAMIAGLCESPLTFQAIIIWRDELNDGKVFLRDIIDLDATYAGPDAKAIMPTPVIGPDGQLIVGVAIPGQLGPLPQTPAPAIAAATPIKPVDERDDGEETADGGTISESNLDDDDDDDVENWLSVTAIEAELKPKVIESFDTIAGAYKRLRRLQDEDIRFQLKRLSLSPAQERKYKKLKSEIIVEVKSLRLNRARIDALVEQLYDINKRLVGYEGRLMRLAESHGVVREDFLRTIWASSSTRSGSTACQSSRPRAGKASLPGTRTKSSRIATISTHSRQRRGSRSASSARSYTCYRRASARRARPRRRWWRRTCASSFPSRRNTPTAACSSSTSSRKAISA